MTKFFSYAPGVIWTAIILALTLFAQWLGEYFGGLAWVPPVVGALVMVIVPILKVLAQGDPLAQGPNARAVGEEAPQPRTRASRWLL